MITLYIKTGCAFSTAVLHELAELNLPYEEKDVFDIDVSEELISVGGKRQTPYLVDSDHGVAMYESRDIVAYLAKTYCGDTSGDNKKDPLKICTLK